MGRERSAAGDPVRVRVRVRIRIGVSVRVRFGFGLACACCGSCRAIAVAGERRSPFGAARGAATLWLVPPEIGLAQAPAVALEGCAGTRGGRRGLACACSGRRCGDGGRRPCAPRCRGPRLRSEPAACELGDCARGLWLLITCEGVSRATRCRPAAARGSGAEPNSPKLLRGC